MKNLRNLKSVHVLEILLALSVAPALTACTDEEVGSTLGAIAVGAVIVAVGAEAGEDHDRRDHDGRGWGGRGDRDERGGRGGHGEGWGGGHRREIWDDAANGLAPVSAPVQVDANSFSSTFGMSVDSSSRVLSALQSAQQKNTQGLLALGFTNADLRMMAEMKVPSETSIAAVAKELNETPETVQSMISRLVTIAAEQKAQAEAAGLNTGI